MLTPYFPRMPMGKPRYITFAAITCLSYFLWEELELTPPEKHLTMVFMLEHRVLLAIFRGNMEGIRMKKVWPMLVLLGRHCTSKLVHVCMLFLQGQGRNLNALVGVYNTIWWLGFAHSGEKPCTVVICGGLEDLLTWNERLCMWVGSLDINPYVKCDLYEFKFVPFFHWGKGIYKGFGPKDFLGKVTAHLVNGGSLSSCF